MYYTFIDSPLGTLFVAGSTKHLKMLSFPTGHKQRSPKPGWQQVDKPFIQLQQQLHEYFAGERQNFNLALAPEATEFQQKVLKQLQTIPYGQTRTYGEIAHAIGQPGASRAVGAANGNNPISIIIPCHRVIGANGSLTGFGGGIKTKQFLLSLEQRQQELFV